MDIKPQNVLDYHGNNAIFMVWNFKDDLEVKDTFGRLCKLVINLNNSADVRFPVSRASCVMGIGHDAWLRLELPAPLPKELENLYLLLVKNTRQSVPQEICIFISEEIVVCVMIWHTQYLTVWNLLQ